MVDQQGSRPAATQVTAGACRGDSTSQRVHGWPDDPLGPQPVAGHLLARRVVFERPGQQELVERLRSWPAHQRQPGRASTCALCFPTRAALPAAVIHRDVQEVPR